MQNLLSWAVAASFSDKQLKLQMKGSGAPPPSLCQMKGRGEPKSARLEGALPVPCDGH